MDAEVSTHTFLTMIIGESVCFMSCKSFLCVQLFLCGTHGIHFLSWKFWIKYFHLICHLILTKINCITLEIRSKADFKSKSENIWQQIILFSRTVMQMICAWHKIWTLSGRLSLMSNVQLMKKNYIPCIPHKNNCKTKKKQNYLLSNILRFALKICFWADF
jgi:hypothetical protein